MKGKIVKIECDLPSFVRYIPDDYDDLYVNITVTGGNPWTHSELSDLFDDLSVVRIATTTGNIKCYYENELIECQFFRGFAYNTASVPDIFKPILDNDSKKMMIASMPHDALYIGHNEDKKFSDKFFLDMVEYYHDTTGTESFLENIKENLLESAIALAFKTNTAEKSWYMGAHLAAKSGAMFKINRQNI